MKYCANCGSQLKDDDMFCENCGCKVEEENKVETQGQGVQNAGNVGAQNTNAGVQNAGNAKQSEILDKLKKINKKFYIIGAVALVAIIAAIVTVVTLNKRINVNKYITVKFDGYNTVGTATYDFDEDEFIKAILKKNGVKVDDLDDLTGKNLDKAKKIFSKIDDDSDFDIKLDKSSDLSNGDKVKLDIKLDKKLGKKLGVTFVAKSKEYKVDGLQEAKVINPFDYVDVTFDGIAPNVNVNIQLKDGIDSALNRLYFSADKQTKINVGDKITVKVQNDKDSFAKNGYILSETSKEYTCDKADEYLSDIKKMSDENLKKIQKDAQDKIQAQYAGYDYDVKLDDMTYEGSYVLVSKSNSYYSNNVLYVIYSANVSAPAKDSYKGLDSTKIYIPVQVSNVILKADGSVKYDSSLYLKGYSDLRVGWSSLSGYTDGATMYKEIVTQNKDNYTCSVEGNVTEFGK